MNEALEITDSERRVMEVVWDEQPVTAQRIIEVLSATAAWTAPTIRTFLHRLTRKKVLKYQTEGNRYVYRAAQPRSSFIRKASRAFLDSVFDGHASSLVAHFVKSHKLSTDEIRQLRELLDEKEGQ